MNNAHTDRDALDFVAAGILFLGGILFFLLFREQATNGFLFMWESVKGIGTHVYYWFVWNFLSYNEGIV